MPFPRPWLTALPLRSFTYAELVAASSSRRVRTAIVHGRLVRLSAGRYATAPHAESFTVLAHASTHASRGILTGSGALFAWGALDGPPTQLWVAAPPGTHTSTPGHTRVFRPASPVPHAEWNAMRVALPHWAAVHAWCDPRNVSAVGEVLSTLQRRLTTVAQIEDTIRQMPRVRNRSGLVDVLAGFESGADSFLEYEALRRTFAGAEFGRFVRRHLIIARGRRRWLDMYDPETRTAVELDGSRFHLPGERRAADDERDADLATLGIQTVRLPYDAVMNRPEWCRSTVRAVLAARS